MALAASELDRCAVCRRHFLLGEEIRLYRDPSSKAAQRVCPLCTPTATRRGWEIVEATRTNPLRIHGDPSYMERAVQRDRLVERLNEQLEGLQHERTRELQAAEMGRSELQIEADRLRRAVAETHDRVTQAQQQAELLERRLERSEKRQRELEAELQDARERVQRVLRARRRESDGTYLRKLAADAFNRSPYADTVRTLARRHGPPRPRIALDGVGLPRRLRVALAWEHEVREYGVSLDLVDRSVSVTELPARERAGDQFRANAVWTPSNGLIADA
jgi:hypothetical protein